MMCKKIFLYCAILISSLLMTIASADSTKPAFDKIVFLGDSLTDNGNMYRHLGHLVPAYPPYYRGRFTNGYMWADYFSYALFEKYQITSINYAVGGATTLLHNPIDGYIPVTAEMELADYEVGHALKNTDNTLYVLWFGANDYLKAMRGIKETPDQLTTEVIAEISTLVNKLVAHKNAEFLIIGLPDLSYTPDATAHNVKEIYHQLSTLHNQKLHQAVLTLRKKYPNTKIVEFSFIDHPLLSQMIESKTYRDEINKKYNLNITNVTDPCIPVDYYNTLSSSNIQSLLLAKQKAHQLSASVNTKQLANEIMLNPVLAGTYLAGQRYAQGNDVCTDPNQHIFWDFVHPTTAGHLVMGEMILDEELK